MPAKDSMNVSLNPQLNAYVRGLVEAGDYNSSSEVVREGLRLLKEKQARDKQLTELRRLIQEGLESPVVQVSQADVQAMMRERLAERRAEVDRGERSAPSGNSAVPA